MPAHERFAAWKLCHQLTLDVYRATGEFPKHELYGLTSQMRRAAVSVGANLAEGASKRGSREFRRYLDISLGSLAELDYLFRCARDLGFLSAERWAGLQALRDYAGAVTWRLYRSLGTRQ